MKDWFQCKIKYQKEAEKGGLITVSEVYLMDAVSYTEVEARMWDLLQDQISEFEFTNIAKTKITDVYRFPNDDTWFKCKIIFKSVDDNGKEKKITQQMLVSAHTVLEAYNRINEKLGSSVMDYFISDVVMSPILEVFDFTDGAVRPKGLKSLGKREEEEE